MGIPQFYRWLSERYPAINEQLQANHVPPFDNLYLDLNGVIHHCSHGNSGGSLFASEERLWISIFSYIRHVILAVKPRKLVYFAVDGVAPRAKMNQQRIRRFRAAEEASKRRAEGSAERSELGLPPTSRAIEFDTNCITPGTEFMYELTKRLRFFVQLMLHEGEGIWKNLSVVLSGPDVPGEGEHKIMDYIRRVKSQPGYNPNTRHCVHGLDADLICLGLLTHEPHFSLIREPIDFGSQRASTITQKRCAARQEVFQFLHLGLLREHLFIDFFDTEDRYDGFVRVPQKLDEDTLNKVYDEDDRIDLVKEHDPEQQRLVALLKQAWDLERIIDDLILYSYLPGNDFLPHLQFTGIGEGGLAKIFTVYREYLMDACYAEFDKATSHLLGNLRAVEEIEDAWYTYRNSEKYREPWLTRDCGEINWSNFYQFLQRWAQAETSELRKVIASAQTGGSGDGGRRHSGRWNRGETAEEDTCARSDSVSATVISDKREDILTRWDPNNPPQSVNEALDQFYWRKLRIPHNDRFTGELSAEVQQLVHRYLEGLQWNCYYYSRGTVSWDWCFDYCYGPYITSVIRYEPFRIGTLKLNFTLGAPTTPLEQLLSVLPPASSALVPRQFRCLMSSDPLTSPLAEFYPAKVEVDREGVKVSWGGVTLLPFLDVKRLRHEVALILEREPLNEAEARRNGVGHTRLLKRDSNARLAVDASARSQLSNVTHVMVREVIFSHPRFPAGRKWFANYVLPGTKPHMRGFPSLKPFKVTSSYFGKQLIVFNGMEGRVPGLHLNINCDLDVVGGSKKVSSIDDPPCPYKYFESLCRAPTVFVQYPFRYVGRPTAIITPNVSFRIDSAKKGKKDFLASLLLPRDIVSAALDEGAKQLQRARERGLHTAWAETKESSELLVTLLTTAQGGFHASELFEQLEGVTLADVVLQYMPAEVEYFGDEGKRTQYSYSKQPAWTPLILAAPNEIDPAICSKPISLKRHNMKPIWAWRDLRVGHTVVCIDRESPFFGFVGELTQLGGNLESTVAVLRNPRFLHVPQAVAAQTALTRIASTESTWYSLMDMADAAGISPDVTLRITRSVQVQDEWRQRHQIGLNLTSWDHENQSLLSVASCVKTRKRPCFSAFAVAMLKRYVAYWPEVFEALASRSDDAGPALRPHEIFTRAGDPTGKLKELLSWCAGEPFSRLMLSTAGKSATLTPDTIGAIESTVDEHIVKQTQGAEVEIVGMKGLWPLEVTGTLPSEVTIEEDASFGATHQRHRIQLGQRVQYVSLQQQAPLGASGTVVGLITPRNSNGPLLQVIFDDHHLSLNDMGSLSSPYRGAVLPGSALLCSKPAVLNNVQLEPCNALLASYELDIRPLPPGSNISSLLLLKDDSTSQAVKLLKETLSSPAMSLTAQDIRLSPTQPKLVVISRKEKRSLPTVTAPRSVTVSVPPQSNRPNASGGDAPAAQTSPRLTNSRRGQKKKGPLPEQLKAASVGGGPIIAPKTPNAKPHGQEQTDYALPKVQALHDIMRFFGRDKPSELPCSIVTASTKLSGAVTQQAGLAKPCENLTQDDSKALATHTALPQEQQPLDDKLSNSMPGNVFFKLAAKAVAHQRMATSGLAQPPYCSTCAPTGADPFISNSTDSYRAGIARDSGTSLPSNITSAFAAGRRWAKEPSAVGLPMGAVSATHEGKNALRDSNGQRRNVGPMPVMPNIPLNEMLAVCAEEDKEYHGKLREKLAIALAGAAKGPEMPQPSQNRQKVRRKKVVELLPNAELSTTEVDPRPKAQKSINRIPRRQAR